MLLGLGLTLIDRTADGWVFKVPSYRFDLTLEVDLLEELARIYGYNRLPKRSLAAPIAVPPQPERELGSPALRRHLVAQGLVDAITVSSLRQGRNLQLDPEKHPETFKTPIRAKLAAI